MNPHTLIARRSLYCGVLLLAGLSGVGLPGIPQIAFAQEKLALDAGKSEVHFGLKDVHGGAHGTFKLLQGEIGFDPEHGTASGLIAVDALSGNSGSTARDRKMTEEELKAQSYKTVSFAPMRFTGVFHRSGDSTLQVHGVFTLVGVSHEIDVPMRIHVEGMQVRATGTFMVPYVQWGLKDPSVFILRVAKEVQIDLNLVGALEK